jgi:hypothetical protein
MSSIHFTGRRRNRPGGLLVLCALLVQPAIAHPAEVVANLDDIARAIETFFPKVSGAIEAIEGGEAVINLGRESGISPGLILTVYRPGEPFSHPLTGEPLGRYEETVGEVEVRTVGEKESRAALLQPEKGAKRGDLVRLTAGRVPLIVKAAQSRTAQVVAQEFSLALSQTGRFLPIFTGEGASSAPSESAPSTRKGADYLLSLDAEPGDPSGLSVRIALSNTSRGDEIIRLSARLEPSHRSDLTMENLQNYLLLRPESQPK